MESKGHIHGYCDERFAPVREAFAENFELGLEVGASFAVSIGGEFVLDIWGGYADAAQTRPWEQNTIVNVWSTTKIMTALSVLMLVDRGLVDLDAPVAKYWPEFGRAGKESILVRHLLSHTAGLPGFDKPITYETLCDWDQIIALLVDQSPWWKPGTKSGYHAITFGYLLGELVRRVTGKTLGTFFREEVALPLGADFHIGLPSEDDFRVAELIPPARKVPGWRLFLMKIFARTAAKALLNPAADPEVIKTRAWRAAEIPASNGHGNARSVARVGSALACGGKVDGVYLLSSSTIERAIKEQFRGRDLVLGLQVPTIRWGLGFALAYPEQGGLEPWVKTTKPVIGPHGFFWGGAGGSLCVMDPDTELCFAYVMNKMNASLVGDARVSRLVEALVHSLGTAL